MDSFIEEKIQAGQLESQGTFSVESISAIRKTLASALLEPHYYLFQIVQGLVAAKAAKIEIAIGRESVVLCFTDEHKIFGDLELVKAHLFTGLTLSSSKPLDLLLTGLATAVGQEMERAQLYAADSAFCLQISAEELQLVALKEPSPSARIELKRASSQSLSFGWTRVWGAMNDETELQYRFQFCSPPIKIAGLPTAPTSSWLAEIPLSGAAGRLLILEAAILSESSPSHQVSFRLKSDELKNLTARSLIAKSFDSSGEELSVAPPDKKWLLRSCTICACPGSWQEAKIWWVRNGMIVECTQRDLGFPGLIVIASADELDLDASGYRLVRNASYERACQKLSHLSSKVLSTFSRQEVEQALNNLKLEENPEAQEAAFDPKALLESACWLK